jgi:cytoskeletal protein CcmA (bactofilin family)
MLNGLFTGLVGGASVLGFASLYSSLLTIQGEITVLNANLLALRTQLLDINVTIEGIIQKTCYLNQNLFSSNMIITGYLNVSSTLNVRGACNIQGAIESPSSITAHSLTVVKNIISTDGNLYIKGSSDLNGLVNIYDCLNVDNKIEALNINVGDSVNIKNN